MGGHNTFTKLSLAFHSEPIPVELASSEGSSFMLSTGAKVILPDTGGPVASHAFVTSPQVKAAGIQKNQVRHRTTRKDQNSLEEACIYVSS